MMTRALPLTPSLRRPLLTGLAVLSIPALALGLQALWAQVGGDRGIAPVATSSDIVQGGISVDVTADTLEEAREKAWKEAERKAWEKLGGPKISDSQLSGMVSAIVIEQEKLGGRRYVGTLGVIFDRSRVGGLLGGGDGAVSHSAPMLTIPVLNSGGAYSVFETRTAWQRVWAEYQAGGSAIDYVRPSGAGGESLLVTFGQTGRHSRTWWGNVLDHFGAADVIMPIAHLEREWPGGPVKGTFTARYGPDSRYLGSFTLIAKSEAGLVPMLEQARDRLNDIYTRALVDGKLSPDPTLRSERVAMDPTIAALVEAGRAMEAAREAGAQLSEGALPLDEAVGSAPAQVVATYVVQFASPDGASVDSTLAAVRAAGGVRGAATSSIAIGGTSVMRVTYAGSLDGLAQELRGRGWQVVQGSNALSISR